MNVIAKISCYFERSVGTLKLRKKYLNTVAYNKSVLLQIKYWTIWYIERYSTSTYTGVSNFQKTVWFLAHPVYCVTGTSTFKMLQQVWSLGPGNTSVICLGWCTITSGIHCLIICEIQLLTRNNLGETWRRICLLDIPSVSALALAH